MFFIKTLQMDFYDKILIEKKRRGLNNKDLGDVLGMNGEAFRMAVKRKSLNLLQIKEIEKYFDLEQNMLNEPAYETYITKNKGVPYYDVDFIGGFDVIDNDHTINPSFFINFSPFNDADYYVNVTGKSMAPLISHGDIIALKKISNWKDFILFGEIYAIVTDEFRTIKIITKGSKEGYFKLIPFSNEPEFVEQEIPIKIINHVFAVKGSIKKFF